MGSVRASARLLLLAALPALAGRGWWCAEGEVVSVTAASAASAGVLGTAWPEFLEAPTAVVAAVGQDAALECRVRGLGDKAVSWVRSRDLQILSHAGAVFTADARVTVRAGGWAGGSSGAAGGSLGTAGGFGVRGTGPARHTLRIRQLRVSDAGRYECQLNTDPKMSLFYNLTVLDEPVPVAVVRAGVGAVRGAGGGAVTLYCEARYEPAPRALPLPALDIRWAKDGRSIDLQSARGGVSLDTERWPSRAVSRLTLAGLGATDAGRYQCTLPTGASDTIHLDVDAESPMEAMQRDQSLGNGARAPAPPLWLAAMLAALLLPLLRLMGDT